MVDELKVFRGKDYPVNEYLTISQRTLDEISDFGDNKYFGYIHTFCATPSDMMLELEAKGIDFVKTSDWELFTTHGLYRNFDKEIGDFIFNGFDFSKMALFKDSDDNISLIGVPYCEINAPDGSIYYAPIKDFEEIDDCMEIKICGLKCDDLDSQIIFTEDDYIVATQYLRKAHKLKYNKIKPHNKAARKMEFKLAMRDRAKAMANKDKSVLLDAISALTNVEGFKYGWLDVWDIKINAFIDALYRVPKIKNANLLLQSGYSGFGIDLSKLSSREKEKSLNWMGSLE